VPRRVLRVSGDAAPLRAGLAALRTELGIPDAFPPNVLAEAEQVAHRPRLPSADLTEVEFATLDPPGSTDLDQAFALQRRAGGGYRVRYAIADVAAFVAPAGPLDAETHRRVETQYAPDRRIPLHPTTLSEGAASLLPGQVRPAVLWTLDLDADGGLTATDVRRATVRSRRQLDYPSVQGALDAGTPDEAITLLREVGRLRQQRERDRGGVSLRSPEQEVVVDDGGWALEFRRPRPVEEWNAQLSLLTGMAAATLMLGAGVGVVRTLPAADPRDVQRLRRVAAGLGIDWSPDRGYADLLPTLDDDQPATAAFLSEATSLFRGASYRAFDGAAPAAGVTHAALAAPYAHCTAPLRRLVDRYVGETCLAVAAGQLVPEWVRAALPALPDTMAEGRRRTAALERASLDLVEAAILEPSVGSVFAAVVVDVDERRRGGTVQLADPAVLARCDGWPLPLGERIDVRLTAADPVTRTVRFAPA